MRAETGMGEENMSWANIIALLGGVALFLFGMNIMGDGLNKVAGNKLEMVLWKLSGTPLKGILLGTVVTAVIQSSSATSAMVVGFVNSGMMTVAQSIPIVMGANIGTSVTGWILSLSSVGGGDAAGLLSTATISAIVAFVGILLLMISRSETKKHIGGILLGFSVLMYGMTAMSDAVSPLKDSQSFRDLLVTFDNPFLGVLIGILVTAVLQSNSASVGILQALSATGVINFATAFPIIMGMGIGASIPVLLSALSARRDGKRTALIYLLINVFGTLICALLFYGINAFAKFSFMEESTPIDAVGIALVNSLYRLVSIAALLPFTKYLDRMTDMMLRGKSVGAEKKPYEIERLEDRFLDHPALALAQSQDALYHMADIAKENLFRALDLVTSYDEEEANKVIEAEDVVDRYEDLLGTYLIKVTGRELNHAQTIETSLYLHTISDFERISDHSMNIQQVAAEIESEHIAFSSDAAEELEVMESALRSIVEMTFDAFEKRDLALAVKVEPLEECIDTLCQTAKLNHVSRLQRQVCTLKQGFVFNDLIGNFERVADHCSNIAVALVEINADSFDTHEYINELKAHKDSEFSRLYEEYRKQFRFAAE